MADMRNRTPFYGAVPTSRLNADHIFMADGSTLQEQADKKFELVETITLEEAVNSIEYTPDNKYDSIIFVINKTDNTDNLRIIGSMGENRLFDSATSRTGYNIAFASIQDGDVRMNISKSSASPSPNNYGALYGTGYMIQYNTPLSAITLQGFSGGIMDAGTVIEVYAK